MFFSRVDVCISSSQRPGCCLLFSSQMLVLGKACSSLPLVSISCTISELAPGVDFANSVLPDPAMITHLTYGVHSFQIVIGSGVIPTAAHSTTIMLQGSNCIHETTENLTQLRPESRRVLAGLSRLRHARSARSFSPTRSSNLLCSSQASSASKLSMCGWLTDHSRVSRRLSRADLHAIP